MNEERSQDRSRAGRTTQVIAVLVIVAASLAVGLLVPWLALAAGVEMWVVILLDAIALLLVLTLAE